MSALIESARANAALIAILAPLLAAGVSLLAPSGRIGAAPAVLGAVISAMAAGDLAWRMLALSVDPIPQAEALIGLRLDGIGVAAAALIAFTAILAALAGAALIGRGRGAPIAGALFSLSLAGWLGLCYGDEFITLLLSAQLGAFALVGLSALGAVSDRAALGASFRLLIAHAVAGGVFLIGAALLARVSGVLALSAFDEARLTAPGAAGAAFALTLGALAMKAGAAPLHGWVGGFYGRAGLWAAIGFGALGAPALLAAFARLAAQAYGFPPLGEPVSRAILALGLASVLIGSVQAMGARDLRRLAAYAAAAQAGCFMIAVAMGSPAGFAAGLVQLAALSAAALGLLVGAAAAPHPAHLDAFDGLARRAPLSALAITAGALSLMGAPLTIGFLGRWRLIEAGVGGGWWWAAGAVIVTSLAGVVYGGRLIERLYFRRPAAPNAGDAGFWRALLFPALLLSALATLAGVDPTLLLRALDVAGARLTGAAP